MLRTSTLLIVMMLAGGPIGSLGCALWCTSPAAEDHRRSVGCHDASHAVPPGLRLAPGAACHGAAAITPFITEARHTASTSVAAASSAVLPLVSIGPDEENTAGWYAFNIPPPNPPSSLTILRV